MSKISFHISFFLLVFVFSACHKTPVPKPRGYFRIDFPEKQYTTVREDEIRMPVSFEYPVYGQIALEKPEEEEKGWFNISFPRFDANMYFTYRNINNDFSELMEQTYRLNIKNHIPKADAINEQPFIDERKKVYGTIYDLKGNTATALQFYATDSVNHYLRGSLYFDAEPDADSLAPVIEFFRKDIIHLIETLEWEK
ncbi:MAG TPA: gliding motility lipoprotein GldD [Bacteroidales bacterium]|nr:gliding motility lipoprotein GldD [Bacteroidales bacterium]